MMMQHTTAKPYPWYTAWFVFLMAPWVHDWHGLSLTRLIATGFATITVHVIEVNHKIGAGEITFGLMTIATAFGRPTFELIGSWIARRGQVQVRQDDTTERIEIVTPPHPGMDQNERGE